jgi:hypothetical protein
VAVPSLQQRKTIDPMRGSMSHYAKRTDAVRFGAASLLTLSLTLPMSFARADEGGVSFWLPGNFGSLAAVPGTPGWTLGAVPYYASVAAGADVARARDIEIGQFNPTATVHLAASLDATARLMFIAPSYVFETPILDGQASVSVSWVVGETDTSVSGTVTASLSDPPRTITRPFYISQSIFAGGDLYPQASLKWNWGVHNLMVYGMGDIPTGAYESNRLANLGIGHGAIDGGGGYTRVLGAGPQIGYLFPVGHLQGFLNLKGYWEFDAQNRPEGHNFWLVFGIAPAAAPAQASGN